MQTLNMMFNLATGQVLDFGNSKSRRLQVMIGGLLGSLVLVVLWGWAAGSRDLSLLLANTYKLPLIVLMSTLVALPAGLLSRKLLNSPYRSSDFIGSYSSGLLSAGLVMAVLAPLLALFYNTSAVVGPIIAEGSVALALLVGGLIFLRGVLVRSKAEGIKGAAVLIPVVVVLALQGLAIMQLIAMAGHILPESTAITTGIDGLLKLSL